MKFRLVSNVNENEIVGLFPKSEVIGGKLWVELNNLDELITIANITTEKYGVWPEIDPTYDWSEPGIITIHFRTTYDD